MPKGLRRENSKRKRCKHKYKWIEFPDKKRRICLLCGDGKPSVSGVSEEELAEIIRPLLATRFEKSTSDMADSLAHAKKGDRKDMIRVRLTIEEL